MADKEKTKQKDTKTGIDILGDVPWGTHFCLFYQNKQDLTDILVPYFKTGLENNEFCMWVTSDPLNAGDVKKSLKQAVPNLDDYIKKGQIEILDYSDWYTKSGNFKADEVLQGWVQKHDQAIEKGFDGLRLTGNTFWLKNEDWKSFDNYERVVNSVIGKYKMLATCTYCLDKCGASEIIDVVNSHQFAIIKREDTWEFIESSERRKIQQALRESEAKYKDLVENMVDVIYSLDEEGNIITVNRATQTMLGREPEEVIGRRFTEYIPKEELPHAMSVFERILGGETCCAETILIDKQGRQHNVEFTSTPVIKDGKVVGTRGIIRDINERKKALEEIEAGRRRLRDIIDAMADSVCITDLDANMTMINKAMEDIFEMPREKLLTMNGLDLITEEDIAKVSKAMQDLFTTGLPQSAEVTGRLGGAKGRLFWMSFSLLKDKKGEPAGIVTVTRDITKRKKVEEELRQTKDYLENLINYANAPIIVWDKELETRRFNRAFQHLTGYESKEVIGERLEMLFPEANRDESLTKIKNTVEGEHWETVEIPILCKDGNIRLVLWNSANIYADDTKNLLATIAQGVDITDRKKAEEGLKELNKELESTVLQLRRTNEELKDFAHIIAHDLKAPLRAIAILAIWMSKDYSDKFDEHGKEQVKLLVGRAQRMNEVVNGLLQYFEIGRIKQQGEEVNLNTLVAVVIAQLAPPEYIEVTIQNELPCLVCEKTRLRGIFQNLLSNAVRYMDKPQGRIEIACVDENEFWKFSVADNGQGIAEEYFEKIFKIFQTLAPRDEYESKGIGLTLAKKTVESWGGKIWVKSKVGKGSTFFFTLPKQQMGAKDAKLQATVAC